MNWSIARRLAGAWTADRPRLDRRAERPDPDSGPDALADPGAVGDHEPLVRRGRRRSATKVSEEILEVPNAVSVVSGEELRRRGTRTLADALQDVVGVDTGNGSDNGPRLPNIGVYGIKEFDALMITLDGVPVGGPFNPNLAMIPVDNIDRIEIVRGPQGTLYGTSAFAGMVQVFTRVPTPAERRGAARRSEASARSPRAGATSTSAPRSTRTRLRDPAQRLDRRRAAGWQERTDFTRDQLARLRQHVRADQDRRRRSSGSATRTSGGRRCRSTRDSRFPASRIRPQFRRPGRAGRPPHDRALQQHLDADQLEPDVRERPRRHQGQSGPDPLVGDLRATATRGTSEGIALYPKETVVYDDAHVVAKFDAAGQAPAGRRRRADVGQDDGRGPRLRLRFPDRPAGRPRSTATFPFGDNRNFKDSRTFVGLYVNDQWTPIGWFTLTVGGREDFTKETLHVFQQEIGDPNFDEADRFEERQPVLLGRLRPLPHRGSADRRASRASASTAPRGATSSPPRRT